MYTVAHGDTYMYIYICIVIYLDTIYSAFWIRYIIHHEVNIVSSYRIWYQTTKCISYTSYLTFHIIRSVISIVCTYVLRFLHIFWYDKHVIFYYWRYIIWCTISKHSIYRIQSTLYWMHYIWIYITYHALYIKKSIPYTYIQ